MCSPESTLDDNYRFHEPEVKIRAYTSGYGLWSIILLGINGQPPTVWPLGQYARYSAPPPQQHNLKQITAKEQIRKGLHKHYLSQS
jgi:hypothetical protein